MLKSIRIERFKSILDETLELGAFNVLIGANGSGKTNVLEAVAFAAGAVTNRLTHEDLGLRGIRVARPGLMRSAFGDATRQGDVGIPLRSHGDLGDGVVAYAVPPEAKRSNGRIDLERGSKQSLGRYLAALRSSLVRGDASMGGIITDGLVESAATTDWAAIALRGGATSPSTPPPTRPFAA